MKATRRRPASGGSPKSPSAPPTKQHFSADPDSVPRARHYVEDYLEAACIDEETRWLALLLASEVATNAVEHAQSGFSLSIYLANDTIRVEIVDESPQLPRVELPALYSPRGRGMFIVDAFSRDWGVELFNGSKAVWFEVPAQPRTSTADAT